MIRTSHRLPLVCIIALAATCLGTALPAHAGASLEVGYFDDGDWVPLSGTASGVMRICVKYTPPPPPPQRTVVGVSLQQIRVTDKRGQHTIPVQFDAGVPLEGGKAAAYLWRSFLDTNGPISIEADGTALTFAPPPVGSGTVSFTVSCSCQSENLTVVELTSDSQWDLEWFGLVGFSPDSPTRSVTATLADAPDPHGPVSDVGNVSVGLRNIGPDGLGSLAWSANWPSEQLGGGGQFQGLATDGQVTPVIYAPNAGALEVDEDSHSWYSPYVSVEGLTVSRHQLVGTRTMELYVDHTNVLRDGSPPSVLHAIAVSMAPLGMLMQIHELSCGGGPREDACQVGPCEAAGSYRFFVTGHDGHGSVSKYAGNVQQ